MSPGMSPAPSAASLRAPVAAGLVALVAAAAAMA
jgi:hypothetical protein